MKPGPRLIPEQVRALAREAGFAEAGIVAEPPDRGVRIEQQLQRMPNASAMSSGSSSK